MPRRNLSKNGNDARPSKNTGELLKAGLFKVSQNGDINLSGQGAFLLNPSNYTENKTSNWQAHNIPGQSNPVHQWISGGSRQVSFDALVTRDTSDLDKVSKSSLTGSIIEKGLNVIGDIASEFAGVNMPPLNDLFSSTAAAGTRLSIAPELQYYRSLLYPIYSSSQKLVSSPPLLVLVAGVTFSGEQPNKMTLPKPGSAYLPIWVLTSLSIKVTKQLPNLDPMEATVTFVLEEYAAASPSGNSFKVDSGSGEGGKLSVLGFDTGIASPF